MNIRFFFIFLSILISSCMNSAVKNNQLPFNEPPQWAQEAIWYQIFVERFRNGSENNNPTLETCHGALEDTIPSSWRVTPWSHNWYQQEDWAKDSGLDFYRTIQMRRYGGDLIGVQEKLPYLKDLGINAIYFNPINDAPSLHKFDARYYHHVDVTFGPDPDGDMAKIAQEDPNDPSTWVMTSADQLFFDIVKQAHDLGIRVVVDFSWNHTGRTFWAFEDIKKNQKNSPFKDWYDIRSFDDPNTPNNEFDYDGWLGIKTLPALKKLPQTEKKEGHPYEGTMAEGPTNHIFEVAKRFMDPNGDGNVSDGIDGMRLDVAEHVPLGFWRAFRKHVRSINPEFFLIGENWWTHWPDELMDPMPWVGEGDIFDAVMHYHWFKPTRGVLMPTDDSLSIQAYQAYITNLFDQYPTYTRKAMMNLGASHDSPRLATSMANLNKYKYNSSPRANPDYNIGPPSEADYQNMKLLVLQQFTWIGSPHIWMGDEMGMWGADDPDNRKPLLWDDIDFEMETPIAISNLSYEIKPSVNIDMLNFYKSIIQLRKDHPTLVHGDYSFTNIGDDLLAYQRSLENDMILVIINLRNEVQSLDLEHSEQYEILFTVGDGSLESLGARSGLVIHKKNS